MQETFDAIKRRYESLRVGQAIYVMAIGIDGSARVIGVGRKWIRLGGGRKVEAKDVLDWWGDNA